VQLALRANLGQLLVGRVGCLGSAVPRLGNGRWLSLNVSPTLVLEVDRLAGIVREGQVPVVLGITEHAPIEDDVAFKSALVRECRASRPPQLGARHDGMS
jgi:hypothetical protein